MRYHNKEETMKADKEILYNVIGYIICDLFLIWYLPNDTWLEIGINIVIMIVWCIHDPRCYFETSAS